MADILIRNWRVPKGCGVCPLNTGAFYCAGLRRYVIEEEHVWMGSNYRRLKDCPLHELPEHGDLIDRGKIKFTCAGTTPEDLDYARRYVIDRMPVIVPSNKGETE